MTMMTMVFNRKGNYHAFLTVLLEEVGESGVSKHEDPLHASVTAVHLNCYDIQT